MSSIRERKAHFHLDQSSAPNQLNYTTNWMSYKGTATIKCFENQSSLFSCTYRSLDHCYIHCYSYQDIIFTYPIHFTRDKLDVNQLDF
jgi:hypothetical protein